MNKILVSFPVINCIVYAHICFIAPKIHVVCISTQAQMNILYLHVFKHTHTYANGEPKFLKRNISENNNQATETECIS